MSVLISRHQVRRFAAAIGEKDPRYFDVAVARGLGHPDLPVPITLLFTLESMSDDTLGFARALGVDPLRVLHGEQNFEHFSCVHANDDVRISFSTSSDRRHETKPMRMVVRQTDVTRRGELVCRLTSTWIIRLEDVAPGPAATSGSSARPPKEGSHYDAQ
jgi:acyl dehydratase